MSAGARFLIWVCEGCGAVYELPAGVDPPFDDHGRPSCSDCLARAAELGQPSIAR